MKKLILGLLALALLVPAVSSAQTSDIDPNPGSSACVSLNNNMRYRSRDINTNGEVSDLQDFLQSKNYLNSEPTGYFGLLTLASVKKFQSANGISPTGFVGPLTRARIKALDCPISTLEQFTPVPVPPTPIPTPVPTPSPMPGQYDDFAQCLSNRGAVFYGAFWSPFVTKTKELFGSSAKFLNYVECSTPDATGQTQICLDKKITSYPTWIFKDGSRIEGLGEASLHLQQLADKTSCKLPGTSSPTLTVLSPNGGETLQKGATHTIKWKDTNDISTHEVKLVEYSGCAASSIPGTYCPAVLPTEYTIANTQGSSYNWPVGKTWENTSVPDGAYVVKVCQSSSTNCDSSDSYFKITSNTTAATISSIKPTSGEVGAHVTLYGSFNKTNNSIMMFQSFPNGSPGTGYGSIFNIDSSDGKTITFRIPSTVGVCGIDTVPACGSADINTPIGNYLIFLTTKGSTGSATLQVVSSTSTQAYITVLSSNGGETWTKGTTQTIKWKDATILSTNSCGPGCVIPPLPPKYYDIELVPYYPPCTTNICPLYPTLASITIAKGVYGSSYDWQVSAGDGSYSVFICQTGTMICDASDTYFKITSSTIRPTITVLSPNGGETITQGVQSAITWSAQSISNVTAFLVQYDSPGDGVGTVGVIGAVNAKTSNTLWWDGKTVWDSLVNGNPVSVQKALIKSI